MGPDTLMQNYKRLLVVMVVNSNDTCTGMTKGTHKVLPTGNSQRHPVSVKRRFLPPLSARTAIPVPDSDMVKCGVVRLVVAPPYLV